MTWLFSPLARIGALILTALAVVGAIYRRGAKDARAEAQEADHDRAEDIARKVDAALDQPRADPVGVLRQHGRLRD
jgi:NaMN:DMB phosphoribosyltransferase